MRIVLTVIVGLVLAGAASGAARPQPWAWDTKTAARQLGTLELFGRESGTLTARCSGRGKAVSKRWVAFRCSIVWTPRSGDVSRSTAFVKVRPVGKGGACVSFVSLAAVPAACLAKGVRVGDRDAARGALRAELGRQAGSTIPYQGPTECLQRGPGYFECFFGTDLIDDPAGGLATVVLGAVPRVVVSRQSG